MVRPDEPGVVIPLPVPAGLSVALVHPDLELETNEMRGILPDELPLTQAVRQWADCSALVVGLYEADWDLIKRSLVDRVAEPHRKRFIPGFDAVKTAGVEAGADGPYIRPGAGAMGPPPTTAGRLWICDMRSLRSLPVQYQRIRRMCDRHGQTR